MSDKKFRPVQGTSEKIITAPYSEGYVYFATDTGKIYLDSHGQRTPMGGGGVAVLYGSDTRVIENADGTYTLVLDSLEEDANPKQDDLIINVDGRFFKIIDIDEDANTISCVLIAVSGGGGGGTPGGGGETAAIVLDAIVSPATSYIYGQDSDIRFKATATLDAMVSITYDVIGTTGRNTYSHSIQSGSTHTFNLGKVLYEGINKIVVTATGENSGTTTKSYSNRKCVAMELKASSNFNSLAVYDSSALFYCTPVGEGVDKVLEIYIDNIIQPTLTKTISTSNQTVSVSLPKQTHGYHTVKAALSATINGVVVRTTPLTYEVAWIDPGNSNPIIWFNNYTNSIINYTTATVPYMVYDPTNNAKAEVHFYQEGTEISTSPLMIAYSSNAFLKWNITNYKIGKNNFSLTCRGVSREFNITVAEDTSRDMNTLTSGLFLNLDSIGRSNKENTTSRTTWNYTNADGKIFKPELRNFNWYNNGWMDDERGISCLRVSNGASVRIPLDVLNSVSLQKSLTFEFQFKIRNVQNYSTLITTESTEQSDGTVVINKVINDREGVCGRYFNNNVGFCIGTQEAFFKSQGKTVNARYKEDELINISFVATYNTRLLYIYLNGIMSGVTQYPLGDYFQANAKYIEFTSDYCDIDLYKVRVYQAELNSIDVVHNYVSDLKDTVLYDQNKIVKYENSVPTIDYTAMLTYNATHPDNLLMPYLVIETTDPVDERLPYFKDGGDAWKVNIEFKNPALDAAYAKGLVTADYNFKCPSFKATGVNLNVQGTSSQGYPRRNYKAKIKKAKTRIYTGGPDKDGSFSKLHLDNAYVGETSFTWKADYMESSGSHNTGLASYLDILYSKHPIQDYIPEYDLARDKYRTTIYGFPVMVFHKYTDGTYEFVGKYNFNLDKGCNNTWGFTDTTPHPGSNLPFEEVCECWELTNNQGTRCAFKKVDFEETDEVGKLSLLNDFEVRYNYYKDEIETAYTDYPSYEEANVFLLDKFRNLRDLSLWLETTDVDKATNELFEIPKVYAGKTFTNDTAECRLAKFKTEFDSHFDKEYTFVYFIITELLLAYDSRGKNLMLSTYGPKAPGSPYIWYPVFYDIDTQLGINNSGIPTWEYDIDATLTGQFSTSNSVLWTNLYTCYLEEIKAKYQALRGQLLNYNNLNGYYNCNPDVSKSYAMMGARPIMMVNIDEYYKYIAPTFDSYIDTSGNIVKDTGYYFYCLQGTRQLQRELFLRNRFNYIDSQWQAGSYSTASINVKLRYDANDAINTSDKYLDTGATPTEGFDILPYPQPLDGRGDFTLTPYLKQYVSIRYDENATPSIKFDKDPVNVQPIEGVLNAVKTQPQFTQQLVYFGGAEYISSLGDLSLNYPDELVIGPAKRIRQIILGNDTPGYYNNGMLDNGFEIAAEAYSLDNVGQPVPNQNAKTLLEELVLSNLGKLTKTIDVSGSEKLKIFRALGTGISGVNLADGVQIETLYLPETSGSLALTEAVTLTDVLTTAPVADENGIFPKGVYIKGVTDVGTITADTATSITTMNIVGGKLGYGSFNILNTVKNIKLQMQNKVDLDAKYNRNFYINMENVKWSPYSLVEVGSVYSGTSLYFTLTDHYTFEPYSYDSDAWAVDLLNERVFIKDFTVTNPITDLSLLDTFIESYLDQTHNYFRDTNTYATGNTLAYISGSLYVNNSAENKIDESQLKNYYNHYYPDLHIYVANVEEAYTVKYIEEKAGGLQYVWDTEKQSKTAEVVKIPPISFNPIKDHYDFLGWSLTSDGAVLVDPTTLDFNQDYVFYAIYELHKYSMKFYNWDNTLLAQKTVQYGDAITAPTIVPYKDDSRLAIEQRYSFKGYSFDLASNDLVNFAEMISIRDYNFYAYFAQESVYASPIDEEYLTLVSNSTYQDPETSEITTGYVVSIKRGYSVAGKITLPSFYNNKPIIGFAPGRNRSTDPGGNGFDWNEGITHIFWFTDVGQTTNLKYVSENCFRGCTNLKYFEIPQSLREIGAFGFASCGNLTNDTYKASLFSIGSQAFTSSLNLPDHTLYIGDTVTYLGQRSFAYSNTIGTVQIGESTKGSRLNTIGIEVFRQNTSATTKISRLTIYSTNIADPIWNNDFGIQWFSEVEKNLVEVR